MEFAAREMAGGLYGGSAAARSPAHESRQLRRLLQTRFPPHHRGIQEFTYQYLAYNSHYLRSVKRGIVPLRTRQTSRKVSPRR